PIMQTDLVLKKDKMTLIVDTKFYSENMVARFEGGSAKQKSGNLYQIFTYINNWQKSPDEMVAGMLLYAKTTALNQPNHVYHIKGNRIFVVTLDLQQDFGGIKEDLLVYANQFFA